MLASILTGREHFHTKFSFFITVHKLHRQMVNLSETQINAYIHTGKRPFQLPQVAW